MKVTGTKDAFSKMINQRGVYSLLTVDKSTVSNWKRQIDAGKYPTVDKMEEMLLKYGAVMCRDKVWDVKMDVNKKVE